MKSRKIICIIVSLILIATSVLIPDAIFASAAADTTAPVIDISTLKVSKKDVKPGDTVRISLKVTDNVKVSSVILTLSSPQTEKSEFCNMKYDISSDKYIYDFNITNNTESGLWRINYISCSDSSSNNSKYFNSKMTTVLTPNADLSSADFKVSNTNADTTAPVIDISTLKVSKKDVKPGDTVRISLKVTDNVKVSSVILALSSPQTEKSEFCNMKYDISSDKYIYDFNITNNTESGLWRVNYISCSDSSSNNSKYFNSKMTTVLTPNADLSAADFNVSATEKPTEERYDFEVALGSTLSLSYEANCDIKWISSDPSIAKVTDVVQSSITMGSYKRIMSSCTIVPVKEGIVTIYAADENGLMLNSAKVKVTKANYVLGDVNNDGRINSNDALSVLQHSVGQITLTGDQFSAGDVVKDGKLNSSDALKILQYSVGSISEF